VDWLRLHRQGSDERNSIMKTVAVYETSVNLNHLTPLSDQTIFTEPWWWRRMQCLKRRFDLNNPAWLSAREVFTELGCSTWNPKFREQVFGSSFPKKCLKRLNWIATECVSCQFSIEWVLSPCKYLSFSYWYAVLRVKFRRISATLSTTCHFLTNSYVTSPIKSV